MIAGSQLLPVSCCARSWNVAHVANLSCGSRTTKTMLKKPFSLSGRATIVPCEVWPPVRGWLDNSVEHEPQGQCHWKKLGTNTYKYPNQVLINYHWLRKEKCDQPFSIRNPGYWVWFDDDLMPSQKPTTQQTEPEVLETNQIAYLIENPATLEHWICSGNLEEANFQVELQSNLLLLKLHTTHVNDGFNLFSWPSLTSQLKLESLHVCLLPKMTWSCPLPADSLGALSDAVRLDTLHHERNSSLELTSQICDVVSPAGTKLHHPLFQMGWLVWKSVRILQNPWNLIVCALGSAPKQSFGLTHEFLHRFHPRIVHGSEISPKRTVNKRKSIFAVRPSRIASPGAMNSDPVILSWQKFGNKNCWGQCPRVLFNTVWRLQSKVLGFFW